MSSWCIPLFAAAAALTCVAQPQAFDVASIRPNASDDNRVMIRVEPGGRFTASGINLKHLIAQAFDVREFQISGGPGWMESVRWNITAKADGLPERVPLTTLRPMLRNLLEERFKLKTHQESKAMPVYALVVAKSGSKLKPSEAASQGPNIRMGRGQIEGKGMSIAMLTQNLGRQLGRSVLDKTDLTGTYDVRLEWTPEPGQGGGPLGGPPAPDALPAVDSDGPTLFTALQEQLGLKLESQRGSVPILVVDSVEKPGEN